MKRFLLFLCAIAILYSSCSKDHVVNPKNTLFKVSLFPKINDNAASTWQQVLNGEALLQFSALSNDTLTASAVKDSLSLKSISTYTRQLVAGTYNITLKTESKAVADTFIRFNAQAQNFVVNKDQAISLAATTTDGVITISESQVMASFKPTFTLSGSTTAINFGLANGYYFIYVTGASSGRITFTSATAGDLYLTDILVNALNQYDITAVPNTIGVVVHKHLFHLKAIVQ